MNTTIFFEVAEDASTKGYEIGAEERAQWRGLSAGCSSRGPRPNEQNSLAPHSPLPIQFQRTMSPRALWVYMENKHKCKLNTHTQKINNF